MEPQDKDARCNSTLSGNKIQLEKWEEKQKEKVCAVDIDGVLNYYPGPWLKYLADTIHRRLFTNLVEAKNEVAYQIYKNVKDAYRRSKEKANLPVKEGGGNFLATLEGLDYDIQILTKRPFTKIQGLYRLTVDWLRNNKLCYSGLISDPDKHVRILLEFPHLKFMVEDHRYIANLVGSWGYKVYLMDNIYNQGELHPMVKRVLDFDEILKELL